MKSARYCALLFVAATGAAQVQSFGPVVLYSAGVLQSPYGMTLGDRNGDGRLDIVTANSFPGTAGVLPGQSGGTFGAPTEHSTGVYSHPYQEKIGDVNGDGRLDIVAASPQMRTIGALLNTGTYTPLATTSAASAAQVTLSPNPTHDALRCNCRPAASPPGPNC